MVAHYADEAVHTNNIPVSAKHLHKALIMLPQCLAKLTLVNVAAVLCIPVMVGVFTHEDIMTRADGQGDLPNCRLNCGVGGSGDRGGHVHHPGDC